MRKQRSFQELNVTNVFLFAALFGDEEICRKCLERILGKRIQKVYVHVEKDVMFHPDSHSIRLDIYARDEEGAQYDVEMQNANEKNLPKRSRYYVSQMDAAALSPGEDYRALKPVYVIFLCDFDPCGEGRYQYTFETVCRETGKPLGDGVVRIFLNLRGKNDEETDPGLVNLLRYIRTSTAETADQTKDPLVSMLHQKVTRLKQSRSLEGYHMTFGELLEDSREEGWKEGKKEGQAQGADRMLHLVLRMSADGLQMDIARLEYDLKFRQEMMRRYGIRND